MSLQATFPNTPSSVPAVRRMVRAALGTSPEATRDRALLMVSELATNALKHGRSGFTVSVECTAEMVRVEVSDSGLGEPRLRHPSVRDPTGRGLLIVQALAYEWGVRSSPEGKVVWFTLDMPA